MSCPSSLRGRSTSTHQRWTCPAPSARATCAIPIRNILTHLRETERFAACHPNYTLKRTAAQAFRNLQIFLRVGQWAMVSKGKAPAIHFVIRHPRLREALERFIPPVVE